MTSAYIDSYYARTLAEPAGYPALEGDGTVDVVVVGGGFSGLATAIELAERGRRVALIEAKRVGWGASGRNGGFASEAFPGGFMTLVGKVGLERARDYQRISRLGLDLVRRRIEEHAIACGPVREGALRCNMAVGGEDLRHFRDFMQESFGLTYEYWPRGKVEDHLSTRQYADALLVPNTLSIHPLNFALGLARVAAARGVAIHEDTPALKIEGLPDRPCIVTPRGRLRADQVVIAGGAYVHGLSRPLSAGTVPVASFVMATEPLGERLQEAIRVPYAIFDNTVAVNYYRPLADTRVLWGGRVLAWEPHPARIAETLRRDMARFYPALAGARVEVAWGGMMPYTRHKMPAIGRLGPAVWYTTGCGGLGVTLTSALGHLIARAIAEGDETWKLYDNGLPFAGGRLGKIPAQIIYWSHQLRAALGRPSLH